MQTRLLGLHNINLERHSIIDDENEHNPDQSCAIEIKRDLYESNSISIRFFLQDTTTHIHHTITKL